MAKRLGNWRHAGGQTLEPKLCRGGLESAESKAVPREGRQGSGGGKDRRSDKRERNGGSAHKGYTS